MLTDMIIIIHYIGTEQQKSIFHVTLILIAVL